MAPTMPVPPGRQPRGVSDVGRGVAGRSPALGVRAARRLEPDGMSDPAVLVERDGHVVTITLNRPAKKNAFNAEVLCRLCDAWDMIDADDDVRAAIMTGAGGNFSAGADLDRLVGALTVGQARRGRVRGAHPPGLLAHLQGVPQGLPPGDADHRRGRGLLLRGRHRDPAGLRRAGRRRGRPDRGERGPARAVPHVGLDGAPAAPDPVDAGDGDADHRRADLGAARLRGGARGSRGPRRHHAGPGPRDRRPHRRQRAARRAQHQGLGAGRRRPARGRGLPAASSSWAWRSWRRRTPRRAPAPSSRSGRRTSPGS